MSVPKIPTWKQLRREYEELQIEHTKLQAKYDFIVTTLRDHGKAEAIDDHDKFVSEYWAGWRKLDG